MELKYEKPVSEKFEIVSCMSSVYFGERWQLYATSIEYNHYFGISRQVYYFMSALEGVYEILREYEKEKLIELRPWAIPNIANFELAGEIWNRDQRGIISDCFLRYREAAEFIIVHDSDELIMFPGGPKLKSTIESLYNAEAAFLHLPAFKTSVQAAKEMANFNYAKTMKNIKITSETTTGKSIYRPERVEIVGVHSTLHFNQSRKMVYVDRNVGIVSHIRDWEFHDNIDDTLNVSDRNHYKLMIKYFTKVFFSKNLQNYLTILRIFLFQVYDKNSSLHDLSHYVSDAQVAEIASIFNARMHRFASNKIIRNLTHYSIYYKLADKCMEYTETKCQALQNCDLPEIPEMTCVQVRQRYHKNPVNEFLSLYSAGQHTIIYRDNGCSIL